MQRVIKYFLPSLSLSLAQGAKVLWPVIFLLPFALWNFTSDVVSYFRYGAPIGQIWYVFSKLFGLYAILLLWYQAISTLLKNTNYSRALPRWTFLRHRALGCLTVLTIIVHITCFVTATSLRKDVIAWTLLLPNFQDFYHMAITLGLFSFLILLMAILAAVLRKYISVIWRTIHRSMIFVVVLGLIHGYLIGTETRYGLYEWFYGALMLVLLVVLILRWQIVKEPRVI